MTLEAYPCPRCKGERNEPDSPWLQCTDCYGNGVKYRNPLPPPHITEPTDEPPGHDLEDTPHE